MNKLTTEERARVVRCLVDGNSMRATARIAGISRNTIDKLLVQLGAVCWDYQNRTLRNLACKRVQVDECWAFCYCKQKQVTPEIAEQRIAGDIWTWAAIDANTKLVPCWTLGKRDGETADAFVSDMASRLADRAQITSDGLTAYMDAIVKAFGENVDYAKLVKYYGNEPESQRRYSPAVCTGFSKKIENHAAAVSLHMMYYNFARVHQTLKTTPAIAAGIADHIWSVEEIVALLDSK